MDAMVTGRMPAGKKDEGVAVLRELGMTSSQAINWLWDFLISERRMPSAEAPASDRSDRLAEAIALADSFPTLVIDNADQFDAKSIRGERIAAKHNLQNTEIHLFNQEDVL
ncbi:hypothetical protein [Slackia heliotrinireducens]|uniref:hypothetical protein n=1 Tax=Slackia heliotrinireducens TaxID=84110 RepID=UPI0033158059